MNICNPPNHTSFVKAIYLHIPFCKEICPFCPFTVRRDVSTSHKKYITGVLNEIENRFRSLNKKQLKKIHDKNPENIFLESIYIGGGTPSRLEKENISLLIEKIKFFFPWSKNIEISIEMNPEDVTERYVKQLGKLGVNRISLGGQSFQDSTLSQLGRTHSNNQLREAIKIIKNSIVKNWNLDLIFGVPKQSFKMFQDDLDAALSFKPPHISLYGLEIHKKTKFGKDENIIKWELKNREEFREMYLWAFKRLREANLFQYEVSNFSEKGKEGRNNLLVWSGNEYLGFGVGAHSFYERIRWSNKKSIKIYLDDINKNNWPIDFKEKLSNKQLAIEFLMLGLRQKKGFNLNILENNFGLKFQQKQFDLIQNLCDSGLAFWEGGNICLTPRGFLIVDRITLDFLPFENVF